MLASLWKANPCHSTSSTPISPSATPSASRCVAPLAAISRSISSRTSAAKSSSFLPQMSRYSWRELASPQNEYHTDTLRGLAMSASRYSSTSSRSACTGESFRARHRRQHALLELRRQVLQRCDQHRGLGVEVEAHDARRQVRQRHHLLHGGARGPVDVQRRDAGVDQALPLALADARTAGGRRRGRDAAVAPRSGTSFIGAAVPSTARRLRAALYWRQVYPAQ